MTTKISIPLTDADALRDYAASINGTAIANTADAAMIIKAGKEIEERRLATGLAKDACLGMTGEYLTAGPQAASYRYGVIGSRVSYRYVKAQDGTREWRVVAMKREQRSSKQRASAKLIVTAKQAEAIKARSVADLVIRAA